MVNASIAQYAGVDALLVNAGITTCGDLADFRAAGWDRMPEIYHEVVLMRANHLIPHMLALAGGSIVCASSISGLIAQDSEAGYNAPKLRVIGLAKCMALDFPADFFRVNAVQRGIRDTALLARRRSLTGAKPPCDETRKDVHHEG